MILLKKADEINTREAEGSNITIQDDIAPANLKEFEVDGKTEQDGEPTPENPQEIKNVKGIGNIFKETQNKKAITSQFMGLVYGDFTIVEGKSYTFSLDTNNNGGAVYPNENYFSQEALISCDGTRKTYTYTAVVTGTYNNVILLKTRYNVTTAYDVSNVQIEEGDTAHTPVPYGHWLPVKISNKNLFDYNWFYNNCQAHNCNKELIDNGIKITFNAGADAYIGEARTAATGMIPSLQTILIEAEPNATYTLSSSSFPKCYVTYINANYDVINTSYINIPSSYTKSSYTFTTPDDVKYIGLRFGIQNSDYTEWEFTNIQLEKGSTATPYTPHEEETTLIDLNQYDSNDNIVGHYELCSTEDVKDLLTIKDGKASIDKNIGKVILDGSEGNWQLYQTSTNTVRLINDDLSNLNIKGYAVPISSHFKGYANNNAIINIDSQGIAPRDSGLGFCIRISISLATTVAEFKTWLSTHNTEVQYVLATPETIELKGEYNLKSYEEVTHIEILDDLEPNMRVEYSTWYTFKKILSSGYNIKEDNDRITQKFANGHRKQIVSEYEDCIINLDVDTFDLDTTYEYLQQLTSGVYKYYSIKDKTYKTAQFLVEERPEMVVRTSIGENAIIEDNEVTLLKAGD